MTDTRLTVVDDLVVSLDYALHLDDGEVIDTSEDQEPPEFLGGQGQIISGLEEALYPSAHTQPRSALLHICGSTTA